MPLPQPPDPVLLPSDGGRSSKENKATFSATVVLLAVLSFVLGAVAVAVPRWGSFRPPGAGQAWGNKLY